MQLRSGPGLFAIFSLLALAVNGPSLAAPAADDAGSLERTLVFADFESETDWRLEFRALSDGSGDVSTDDLETPPLPQSTRYLYISFRAAVPTGLRVRPPGPIEFTDYVRRFEFWALGTGHADEIFFDLIDATEQTHRLSAGRLDFVGWRKLQVALPAKVRQRSPAGRTGVRFRGIYLSPAGRMNAAENSLFSLRIYVDHFMAITRDRLRQPPLRWERFSF